MTVDMNVVARLRRRIDDARSLGFKVRLEPLDGEQATWCEIAGIPTLFVDLSQTAAEQLQQLNEALDAFHQQGSDRVEAKPVGAECNVAGASLRRSGERAA